jgi:hypothetical protein
MSIREFSPWKHTARAEVRSLVRLRRWLLFSLLPSYERTLPVYNGTIDFQPNTNVYVDPKYPMMIISGSAGCREFFNYYDSVFYGAWSVYRSASYGYGHLTIHNSTHLYWDQLIDEGRGGKDTMWIVKKGKKKVFHQPTAVEEDDARDFEPIALE